MPIPTSTANAAMSIVVGLVRLTGRIDNIMAEEAALREELALAGKIVVLPPRAAEMKRDLQGYLESSATEDPDPLDGRRDQLTALLAQRNPAGDALLNWLAELLPEKVVYKVEDPSANFTAKLRAKRAGWDLEDEEILRLGYYLSAGEDLREADLPWQLATAVVAVLAEVAVQNQALIFRDDRARPILVAVLSRFSKPDLAHVGSHRALLRFVLKATVNSALDHPDKLGGDKVWVERVLSALAKARGNVPDGEDFVIGLVHGRGYPTLIGSLLEAGAGHLGSSDADRFESLAADLLTQAGALVREQPDFEGFFRDHWGDLLHAGINAVQSNGHLILADEKPLLRQTLLAAIQVLAETQERQLLSSETLTALVEAAIGAVAVKPELLDEAVRDAWLRELLTSTAAVVAGRGVRETFSPAGLEALLQSLAAEFAQQPELLVKKPGLGREVLGSMLEALAVAGAPRLEVVASTGVQAVLNALSNDPALADTRYPALVAGVAGQLAMGLQDTRLTRGEVADLLRIAAQTIAAEPSLVGIDQETMPAIVVTEVLRAIGEKPAIGISGRAVQGIVAAALQVLAADPGMFQHRPERIRDAILPVLAEFSEIQSGSGGIPDRKIAQLADLALHGVLSSLLEDPALIDSRYPSAVGKVAAAVAERLVDGKLSAKEAQGMLQHAAEIIAVNPGLLANEEVGLAALLVQAVVDKVRVDAEPPMRGPALVGLVAEALAVIAAHGRNVRGDESVEKLVNRVLAVIDVGLEKATREFGRLVDRRSAPLVVGLLLRRWALDEIEVLDVDDPGFEQLFEEIVSDVQVRHFV